MGAGDTASRCPSPPGRLRHPQDAPHLIQMRIIAFLTDFSVVDRIINYLKLTFVADKPPPPGIAFQEVLMAAEASAEYFS